MHDARSGRDVGYPTSCPQRISTLSLDPHAALRRERELSVEETINVTLFRFTPPPPSQRLLTPDRPTCPPHSRQRATTRVFSSTGATPLVFSIIGDLFSVENRVLIAIIPGMAMGVGQLVGQGMAGYIGDKYNWCAPTPPPHQRETGSPERFASSGLGGKSRYRRLTTRDTEL